mgnify:CR=1 FL=1
MENLETNYAKCCRIWPVIKFVQINKCGFCGEFPIIDRELTREDYDRWKESHG